ncbi:MAG: glycosyltransferase, partial [Planctomycetes bacterium]|nr:glycosyltransferase [Planctomycetota bacterium]
LRRLARELGVDARFLGALTDDDLPGLFTGARAIVVPSRYEGFGLAALEGLAAGRPTLVADAGALPEVVGDAGVVLPTDDSQAWADAIRGAADPGTQSPSDRRARAAEFTWRRAAERTVALWRQLAATSAPIAPRS